jgi:hypothetical protein
VLRPWRADRARASVGLNGQNTFTPFSDFPSPLIRIDVRRATDRALFANQSQQDVPEAQRRIDIRGHL